MVGSLGTSEMLVIAIIVFLLFGGAALPKLMRSLGRAKGEFLRAQREMDHEVERGASEGEKPAEPATPPVPARKP